MKLQSSGTSTTLQSIDARLRVAVDPPVDRRCRRRDDDEEPSVQVVGAIAAADSSIREQRELGNDLRRDDGHVAPASSRPCTFSSATFPAPTTSTLAAGQVEARHVVALLVHRQHPDARQPRALPVETERDLRAAGSERHRERARPDRGRP